MLYFRKTLYYKNRMGSRSSWYRKIIIAKGICRRFVLLSILWIAKENLYILIWIIYTIEVLKNWRKIRNMKISLRLGIELIMRLQLPKQRWKKPFTFPETWWWIPLNQSKYYLIHSMIKPSGHHHQNKWPTTWSKATPINLWTNSK